MSQSFEPNDHLSQVGTCNEGTFATSRDTGLV